MNKVLTLQLKITVKYFPSLKLNHIDRYKHDGRWDLRSVFFSIIARLFKMRWKLRAGLRFNIFTRQAQMSLHHNLSCKIPGRSKVNFDLQFPLLTFTAGLRLGTFQKTFYMFSGVTLLPKASISLKVWRDASTLHNRPFCTSWDD